MFEEFDIDNPLRGGLLLDMLRRYWCEDSTHAPTRPRHLSVEVGATEVRVTLIDVHSHPKEVVATTAPTLGSAVLEAMRQLEEVTDG